MHSLRDINEYLFYEFGRDLDEDETAIGDDHPFELVPAGEFRDSRGEMVRVFRFSDGRDEFYALANHQLDFFPAWGMSPEDLRIQDLGGEWVAAHEPVDLDTTRIGYASFPSLNERRARTESMLTGANLDPSVWRIRLGLFLTATSRYLALTEKEDGTAFVLGAADDPVPARFPGASPWRRLAHTLGRLIEAGELSDPS